MSKKRKLKIFPVICTLIFLAVLLWSVVLLVRFFFDNRQAEPNNSTETNDIQSGLKNDNPDVNSSNDDEPISQPVPEIPDEDKTVFNSNAPKPVLTHAELLSRYPDSVLAKSESAGDDYINSILFIGDSTTNGLKHYAVLEGGKETNMVWTPKSGTLAMWNLLTENIVYPEDNSEMLIKDAIAIKTPERVVITLGVNGVASLSENEFKKYYQELIDEIKKQSPDTIIILQSIYPVCDYYEYVKSISMEKINTANTWIADLAASNGIYYLNTISALVTETGYLNNDYCNGDGIHISKEGFEIILDYIKTHTVQ